MCIVSCLGFCCALRARVHYDVTMRAIFGWLSVALCAGFSLAGPVFALPANAYCSGPVRIALFEFGAMYRVASKDGVDVGLIDELEKRTGCTFERLVRPRARIWKELESGTLDMATSALRTPERSRYLFFTPYMQVRNLVLVRRSSAPSHLTLTGLEASGLRMGVVRGFRHEPVYDELVLRMRGLDRVVEAVDVADLLRMLDRKLVDVVLSQPVVYAQYVAPEVVARDYDVYDWAPAADSAVGSLVFSRQRFTPEQFKRWDALLQEMLRDGTITKIARQYVSPEQARELVYSGPRLPDEAVQTPP